MSFAPPAPAPVVTGVTSGSPLGPQHINSIAALINDSLSGETSVREPAEAQMKQLQNSPGWRCCLLTIGISGNSYPVNLRTMALILFKNQIENLFRRTYTAASISRDQGEKDMLKNMLLTVHSAGAVAAASGGADSGNTIASASWDQKIAGFVSLCVAMIAKHDWWREWPTLFPTLLECLQSSSHVVVSRTLYTLHQTMKALQASRLCTSRLKFQQATQQIIPCIRQKFMIEMEKTTSTIASIIAGGNVAAFTLEVIQVLYDSTQLCLLSLKCLMRLILYGVGDIHSSPETTTLFPFYLSQLQKLVGLLPQLDSIPSQVLLRQLPAPLTPASPLSSTSPASSPKSPVNVDDGKILFYTPLFQCALLMFKTINDTFDGNSVAFRGYFIPFVEFSVQLLNTNATSLTKTALLTPSSGLPQADREAMGYFPQSTALEPLCSDAMKYLKLVLHYFAKDPSTVANAFTAAGLSVVGMGKSVMEGGAGSAANNGEIVLQQIREHMSQIFNPQFVHSLLTLLITHYLVLKHADIEQWSEEPEEFYNEERSGSHDGDDGTGDDTTLVVMNSRSSSNCENSLRGSAEVLIIILLQKLPEAISVDLTNMLLQILGQCAPGCLPTPQQASANSPNMLLIKESIYTALGYAYLQVPLILQETHKINFEKFFREVLSKDLANSSNAYRIVRRRVMWLMGEWVERIDDSVRMDVYKSIVTLLQENDLLVRMTAVDTLFKIIDHIPQCEVNEDEGSSEENVLDLTSSNGVGQNLSPGFEQFLDQFSVHLRDVLTLLFQILVNQMQELQSKKHVLVVISKFVGVMRTRILSSGCLDILLAHLPALWQNCVKENQALLRSSILTVINQLIDALGYKSQMIHASLIYPIISFVMDPNYCSNSTNVLVEECLEVWKTTLTKTVIYSNELDGLFPLLLSYLSKNTSHLMNCVEIIESYIHLGRDEFLRKFAGSIGELFASLLTSSSAIRPEIAASKGLASNQPLFISSDSVVNEDAIVVLMPVLEALVQLYPKQMPQLFARTFWCMLKAIFEEAQYAALSDEEKNQSKINVVNDQVLAGYFTVFGRLFFQNIEGATNLLASLSGTDQFQFPVPVGTMYATLLEVWTRKLDSIGHLYKKKVCVLGMNQMLTLVGVLPDSSTILSRFKLIVTCNRRVEKEMRQPGAYLEQPDWSGYETTAPEERIETHRIQWMLKEDPANLLNIRSDLLEKVNILAGKIGAQAVQQLIATVDPFVWKSFETNEF